MAQQHGPAIAAEAEAEAEFPVTGGQAVTPKERREAQIELRDMATTLENRFVEDSHYTDTKRLERARLLRAVAAELDRVPEEQ